MTEKELLESGYRKYPGETIDVFYDIKKCVHAGECVRGNGDVFKVKRKPWIIADNASAEEVALVVDSCPSGALKYIRKEEMDMEFLIDSNRFYLEDANGELTAEITFTRPNDDFFIIDHTRVNDSLRGQGVAQALVKAVVDKARAENMKIIPLCPFAKLEFEKKEEYADVWRR